MYALCALGLVLIYKTSGVANLAQGALIMTGGYLVAWLAMGLGLPVPVAILIGLVCLFLMGFLIERLALRTMIGQPVIMIIMLTLGLEILLRGLIPALGGSDLQRLDLGISQKPLIIADMFINRAYLFGGAVALIAIGLSALFFHSRRGVILRAVSDDQPAPGRLASGSKAPSHFPGGSRACRPCSRACFGGRCRAWTGRCRCCSSRGWRSRSWGASTALRERWSQAWRWA